MQGAKSWAASRNPQSVGAHCGPHPCTPLGMPLVQTMDLTIGDITAPLHSLLLSGRAASRQQGGLIKFGWTYSVGCFLAVPPQHIKTLCLGQFPFLSHPNPGPCLSHITIIPKVKVIKINLIAGTLTLKCHCCILDRLDHASQHLLSSRHFPQVVYNKTPSSP